MRLLPRVPRPARPRRRGPGRGAAAVLTGAAVLAVLAVLAASAVTGHQAPAAGPARPAAVTLARTVLAADTVPAAPAATRPGTAPPARRGRYRPQARCGPA